MRHNDRPRGRRYCSTHFKLDRTLALVCATRSVVSGGVCFVWLMLCTADAIFASCRMAVDLCRLAAIKQEARAVDLCRVAAIQQKARAANIAIWRLSSMAAAHCMSVAAWWASWKRGATPRPVFGQLANAATGWHVQAAPSSR